MHSNRRSRRRTALVPAVVELLEDRQLLTAALANGVLTITGDRARHRIFNDLDSNKNASVVDSEVTEKQWNRLEDADSNNDDAVSQTEFTTYLQDWLDNGKSFFRFLSQNKWYRRLHESDVQVSASLPFTVHV